SINLPDQNDLISAYLGLTSVCSSSRLHVRAEIFEVSDSYASRILESAAGEADHTPERKAVLAAVEKSGGRRVEVASLSARSGLRSRMVAGNGMAVESGERAEKADLVSGPASEEE